MMKGSGWVRGGNPDVPLAVRMIRGIVVEIRLNARCVRAAQHEFEQDAILELAEYLAGERTAFDLSIDLDGSPFDILVWEALRRIPYGETVTYGELATRIGKPDAARAVGSANARNPIPLVVPCHRVVAAGGKLGGYGGGLRLKRRLLDLEAGQGQLSGEP